VVPLAPAPSGSDRLAKVYGGHCGYGECWFPCPGVPPFLIWCYARGGGALPQERQVPSIRARDGGPSI
jgi:hypothetical protein